MSVSHGLQQCASADYGFERGIQARLMKDTARATIASIKLANGLTEEAANDCNLLLYFNSGDHWCHNYNSEAQVCFHILFIFIIIYYYELFIFIIIYYLYIIIMNLKKYIIFLSFRFCFFF